ncbi:hypothetical protein MTR67_051594 [Solanum verrucosum]|uniref:Uncharacterized protein n=1 Tax=Solanum verrucosum TaxID=315347 RepID=A0AAF0V6H3_SOLVR|nr:hypothetical protein MTR67_051594 [Solanum verrucosum]
MPLYPRKAPTVRFQYVDQVISYSSVFSFSISYILPLNSVQVLSIQIMHRSVPDLQQYQCINMALFKALYGRRCRSPMGWFGAADVKYLGVDLVKDAQDKVRSIQTKLLAGQSR